MSGPSGLSMRDRLGVKVNSERLLLLQLVTNMDDISGDIIGELSPPHGTSLMLRLVSDTSSSSCRSSACSLRGKETLAITHRVPCTQTAHLLACGAAFGSY